MIIAVVIIVVIVLIIMIRIRSHFGSRYGYSPFIAGRSWSFTVSPWRTCGFALARMRGCTVRTGAYALGTASSRNPGRGERNCTIWGPLLQRLVEGRRSGVRRVGIDIACHKQKDAVCKSICFSGHFERPITSKARHRLEFSGSCHVLRRLAGQWATGRLLLTFRSTST